LRLPIHNVGKFAGAVLVAAATLLVAPSLRAKGLRTIHLPGPITPNTSVALALAAPDTLYAAYWTSAGKGHVFELSVYAIDVANGRVTARADLGQAVPLRTRNGYPLTLGAWLRLSPDGSILLCEANWGASSNRIFTLAARGLHLVSARMGTLGALVVGFANGGDVRLLRIHKGGKFGQEIDSATILDLDARDLDKVVSQRKIRLQESAWSPVAVGSGDRLWALDERPSVHGDPRITVYSLLGGKPIATHEVPLAEARVGVPAAGPRPKGKELPAPTGIAPLGTPPDAPQLAQLLPTARGLLGVVDQPVKQWAAWSRIIHVGVSTGRVGWSSVLTGCNLNLRVVGRSGRIAVGSCDLVGRVLFDNYAIKKSDAVFVSTRTGSVVAVVPLNTRRPPLSLAIDDTVRPAIAAVYDQHATVRLLSVP
jgi:hypothetical protein